MKRLTAQNSFFFFNDAATTEIYTLSLHDALPISSRFAPLLKNAPATRDRARPSCAGRDVPLCPPRSLPRSEEHTSELQSHLNLVCRLLLEKKKKVQLNSFGSLPADEHVNCAANLE